MNRVKLSQLVLSIVLLSAFATVNVNAAHHENEDHGAMVEEHKGSMMEKKGSMMEQKGSMKAKGSMQEKGSMVEQKGSMKAKGSHADVMGTPEEIKAAMMEKWKVFATPNANHQLLKTLVGKWDYSLKWSMSPNGPAEESTGTTETQWILGGRFIQQKANGTSMGQPFEGLGITGYDNYKKVFTSTWLDNMGTGVMTGTSTYNAQTQTFVETGSVTCPFEGKKTYRSELKVIDDNQYTYKMFTNDYHSQQEFLSMEITYTRKK